MVQEGLWGEREARAGLTEVGSLGVTWVEDSEEVWTGVRAGQLGKAESLVAQVA